MKTVNTNQENPAFQLPKPMLLTEKLLLTGEKKSKEEVCKDDCLKEISKEVKVLCKKFPVDFK